jgi:hypothetical protein
VVVSLSWVSFPLLSLYIFLISLYIYRTTYNHARRPLRICAFISYLDLSFFKLPWDCKAAPRSTIFLAQSIVFHLVCIRRFSLVTLTLTRFSLQISDLAIWSPTNSDVRRDRTWKRPS